MADVAKAASARLPRLGSAVRFAIAAISLLSMAQAMTLSFFERFGMARGFGSERVTLALVIYGIVSLFPAPLAALLEKRLPAVVVISVVSVFQSVFSMSVTHTASYPLYAMAGSAIAAFIGGTLVKFIGYQAIGYAATVLVALELVLFNMPRILMTRRQFALT